MSIFSNLKNKIKYLLEKKEMLPCWEAANRFVMLSDGTITTCCADPYGKNSYGNVEKTTIEKCINSKKFKKITNRLSARKVCRRCGSLKRNPTDAELLEYKEGLKNGFKGAQIEIAASCNYACTGCASNTLHTKRNPIPDLDKVYENLKTILPKLEYINCFNFGEPFLNPKFISFIEKCRKNNPSLKIGTSTNGMLLTKEKAQALVDNDVNWVIVSLHGGPGTENLLKYANRGANYETVIKNIKQLKEVRDNAGKTLPKIGMRAILFNWNDTDEIMDEFRQAAKEIGIDNPCCGSQDEDNYHWILDGASPSERSSQRFLEGNEEYNKLKERKEVGL